MANKVQSKIDLAAKAGVIGIEQATMSLRLLSVETSNLTLIR